MNITQCAFKHFLSQFLVLNTRILWYKEKLLSKFIALFVSPVKFNKCASYAGLPLHHPYARVLFQYNIRVALVLP